MEIAVEQTKGKCMESAEQVVVRRLLLPDLLKGFAVFWLIPIHIIEFFINDSGRESLFGKIILFLGGPFTVPIFMVIMGYFMAKNNKPFLANVSRGLKVFAVGFFLNIGLNLNLLFKIKYRSWPFQPLEYILGVDILYFAGIALIFLSFLKLVKKGKGWLGFCLFLVVTGVTGYMNEQLMLIDKNYIVPFVGGTYSWSYFPLFPWLGYPLLGFSFAGSQDRIMNFLKGQKAASRAILFIIASVVLYYGKSGFETTIYLPTYYHHTFWFSLWAVSVVILWVTALHNFILNFPETNVGNFLIWLGRNITSFYVIQWLIIGNIATEIFQTQPINSFLPWFAGIFATTALLTWLLEKMDVRLAK